MMDAITAELIISNESLKLRVGRLEDLLLNLEGFTRDADGVLMYTRKAPPTPTIEEV